MKDRIRRITEMEGRLRRIAAWLENGAGNVEEDVRLLDEYYRSPLWRLDFEADEAGALPPDLPRGVLSEDAVYNALEDYEERKQALSRTEKLLHALCDRCQEILGENFTGLYLHGSYATAGFNPRKSDLDYIILCEEEPSYPVKRALMDATFAYLHLAPAKGLEMHLVLKRDVLHPVYPPRYVLHASPAHTEAYLLDPKGCLARLKGRDPDLTAHFAVMYARGRAFRGPAVRSLFQPVPHQAYLQSIANDMKWDPADALYHVLNACRTAAYLADGSILSKTEGAAWALAHLPPRDHPLIREALRCAQGDRELPATKEAEIFCQRIARQVLDALENEPD